ncbi:MAG TPA: transcriptional regulator [Flavobacterium sp.]|nr:transcriptional regulator [Flavobacterium sp.]
MKLITLHKNAVSPLYKQIIECVERAIFEKRLFKNDKLPSVNKVSMEFSVSRDTVLLAYNELKKRGIIYSILGKGYYVKSVHFNFEQRFFLLFDELNIFKEDIYNSFLKSIDGKAQVELFFHHFNSNMFAKIINESNGNYSKYIIMPGTLKNVSTLLNTLPPNDVYILDQTNQSLSQFPSVHQDFANDIYEALQSGIDKIMKYKKLILIFPGLNEPYGMVEGFYKFCDDYHFLHQVISSFDNREIKHGEVYIIPNDRHLVEVIEQSKIQNMKLIKDFGVISYNDTDLKKIVENGITTISTDFKQMGRILAQMVLSNKKETIKNSCQLILRNSL